MDGMSRLLEAVMYFMIFVQSRRHRLEARHQCVVNKATDICVGDIRRWYLGFGGDDFFIQCPSMICRHFGQPLRAPLFM